MKTISQRVGFWVMCVVVFCAALVGCNKKGADAAKKHATVITATMQTPVTNLYWNGTLEPISHVSVFSPTDGRITKLHFVYGQRVDKNQLLAVLSSPTLSDKYHKAIADYLQKKDAYANAVETFQGNLALYKAGVISRSEFLSDRSTYETTVLGFFQSRFELGRLLKEVGVKAKTIEGLNISDHEKVHKLLTVQFKDIKVTSPATGIALFPLEEHGSTSEKASGKLQEGTEVKRQQLMLSIGDMSGLSVEVSVGEASINRLKPGMPATITSDAFPGTTLKGKIVSVASQADPSSGGGSSGQSDFKVVIDVSSVPEKARKLIRVGMTAKVQVAIKGKKSVMLPINAIIQKGGQRFVAVQSASNPAQFKQVSIETGSTTPDGKVVVLSGVKAGDKVRVND